MRTGALLALLVGCGAERGASDPASRSPQSHPVVVSMGEPTPVAAPVAPEALTARWPKLGLLADEPLRLAVGAMNLVPAPCAACEGRTMASCAQAPPDGCQNLDALVGRTIRMVAEGADLDALRDGLSFQDVWVGAVRADPPNSGSSDALAEVVVWLDPLGSLTPPALETARALLEAHPGVITVGWRLRVEPADVGALDVAAIALMAGDRLPVWLAAASGERTALRSNDSRTREDALIRVSQTASVPLPAPAARTAARTTALEQTASGEALGVRVAPTWFIDGYRLRGAQSVASIDDVLDRQLDDAVATGSAAGGSGTSTSAAPAEKAQ